MTEYYIDHSGIIKHRETSNITNHITNLERYTNQENNEIYWIFPDDDKPLTVRHEDSVISIRDEGYNSLDNLIFYFVDPIALQLYFEYLGTEKEFTLIRKKCKKCGKYKKGKGNITDIEKEILKRYGDIYGIGGIKI